MEVTFTIPNEKDYKKCASLAFSALKEYAYYITLQESESKVLESLENFFNHELKNTISKENFIVAKINDEIVGSCTCYKGSLCSFYNNNIPKINKELKADKEKLKEQEATMLYIKEAEDTEYYLDTLAVDKNFQGLGLSKKLIKKAIEKAKNDKFNNIAIVVNNETLFSFYEKLGFKKDKQVNLCGIEYTKMKITF